jgi:hypothetical protein
MRRLGLVAQEVQDSPHGPARKVYAVTDAGRERLAITAAGREWRRLGVPARDRQALAADLRLDLEAAVADGVPADQLIDGDVTVFARRLAEESGVRHVPPRYGQIVASALAGAVAGALTIAGFAAAVTWARRWSLGRLRKS